MTETQNSEMPQPRLKRVEIQGFKTFASRAEFDLPEGIVAFVGPNGSGKSNLVDAIRWGMGEQNPRLIRCRRSEEVVFGGGASLPPAGMAEVTLLFDNCDHWLDLDYEEVQIARRAYRSGENEYLLNGRKVRLKDIQGLFARAGLTESGSIVVGQGMIDSVLSLRPDRRRAFFEDIAGLAHCRARLTQARVELGRTNDNLSRVADLLAEIKPRLEPLSRRAGAVLRYREIADQLYEMLGRLFASRLAKLSTKLRSNKDKFAELDANISEQESEYRQLETNIQEFLAAEMTAERELSDLRGDISRQRATLVEAERTAAILTERRSATKEQLNSLVRDLDRTLERIANLSKEQDGAQAQLDSANNEVAELNRRLKSLDRNLSKTSLRRVQLESQRRESSERQAQSDRELIQLETRRAGLDSRRESLLQRHSRTKQQLSGCEERLRGSEAAQRALAGQRSEIERAETALSESIRSTRTKREQTIANVGNARKHCFETRNRFNALQSQMTALNHIRESGESLYLGVKNVLSAAKNGHRPARLRGIVGVVASLIEAPAELETALEVALGAHLQDIVVERWNRRRGRRRVSETGPTRPGDILATGYSSRHERTAAGGRSRRNGRSVDAGKMRSALCDCGRLPTGAYHGGIRPAHCPGACSAMSSWLADSHGWWRDCAQHWRCNRGLNEPAQWRPARARKEGTRVAELSHLSKVRPSGS